MNVVVYCGSDDIGGVGHRTGSALNRLRPDWTVHAYRPHPSYLQFPEHTPWDWARIVAEWLTADITHSHDFRAEVGQRKANVVTYHGTGFRETPDWHLEHAGDARVLVSTLDLWLQKPDAVTWCPQFDDLDALAAHRTEHDGPIRICHAPTNRFLKSTDLFLAACERLARDVPIEVVLIEGRSWTESLALKGTCDILFDQTAYGYGGNAIEAWGMRIPVVSGGPDALLDEYVRRFGGLPFVRAEPTAESIYLALARLIDEPTRTSWGLVGRRHAERHHSYEAGVDRLVEIYSETAR